MEKENPLKLLNEYIQKLDSIEPVFEYERARQENGKSVNEALASAFAIEEFRKHLLNKINKQIYRTAVECDNEQMMLVNKGRITALKELYQAMQFAYTHIPKK